MQIINLIIIILFFMLALVSRKHFSKYKNVRGSMSLYVYELLYPKINFSKKRTDLRKINVVSESGLDEICRLYYTRIISICMVVIFVINLACLLLTCIKKLNRDEVSNVVQRGDYDDGISVTRIYIGEPDEQTEYELLVHPREYTYEEFEVEANKVFIELSSDILGNNTDLMHIDENLILPSSDRKGRFDISWSSDYPEYILPSGEINFEELRSETEVNLVARIEYLEYKAEKSYTLMLVSDKMSEKLGDSVGVVLEQIETNSRNASSFELPNEIEGKRISLRKTGENPYKQLSFLGIAVCVFTVVSANSMLDKKKSIRDNMLKLIYPSFVNRIYLLMGAGMNIRNCMYDIIANSEDSILVRELEYTMNQIKSGYDESCAYEELGIRIGLTQYNRLMGHISQNLRMGTKDLRVIMADEVKEAMKERKEYAKKKGEKSSTKLLFPMIALMAVVIVIIMLPAFVGL